VTIVEQGSVPTPAGGDDLIKEDEPPQTFVKDPSFEDVKAASRC